MTLEEFIFLCALVAVGAAISVGQLLNSDNVLTLRKVLGRMIIGGGLALASAGLTLLLPGISLYAQIGIAGALASIGTPGVERLLERVLLRT